MGKVVVGVSPSASGCWLVMGVYIAVHQNTMHRLC